MSEAKPDGAGSAEVVRPSQADAPAEAPYRNLFVPLFVVPAMIVMVLVLVFALFGQIAGSEASLEENLERVRHAGANEREQALFHVVQQVEENWLALDSGRELPWPVEGDLAAQLGRVFDETPRSDASFRYVLAAAMTQMRLPGALDRLKDCLDYTETEDPDALVRFNVLLALGMAGRELTALERSSVVARVIPFLDHQDAGLRLVAAGVLQNLPSEESRAALRGLLGAGSLELRGQAAVSLSHLGDPAGAAVLWEMLDPQAFEREQQEDPAKWRDPRRIKATREDAVEALVRLERTEDLERLREVAEEEEDLDVREAALRGIRAADEARGE